VLEGHIVPDLTVASLVGKRILCKLGCTVLFTDTACYVRYQGKVILTGYKDPSTDLWVLPITPDAINQEKLRTSQGHNLVSAQSQAGPSMARAPQFPVSTTPPNKDVDIAMFTKDMDVAMFTQSVRTCANAVKFSHQSLCNPKISSLMKALRKGYLKGCPNLSKELVTKYLNPSPATAKGHMKRPKKGIRSTTKQVKTKGDLTVPSIHVPAVPQAASHPLPLFVEPILYNGLTYNARREVNLTMSQLQMGFVLEPSPIKSVALCTMTSQGIFPS
jgi:hypothetical protein